MSYGFASHIGIAKETDWGTPLAATGYFEALSEGLARQIDRFETANIVGRFAEPDDQAGVNRYAGDIVAAANAANMGHFCNGAFGQNSVTVVLSGVLFTNIFRPRQSDLSSKNPLPAYTLEVFRAGTLVNSSSQISGIQFGGITFNAAPNQDLRLTMPTVGKTEAFIAKTTPTFPTSPVAPFLFSTASVQLPGGSAVERVEALNISLDNRLEGVPALNNSDEIAKVRRTDAPGVLVTGTIDFVTLEDLIAFQNQTEQRMVVSFTRANSFAFVIDIPRLVFTEFPINVSDRGRLTAEFSMRGRYHVGSATNIEARLTTTNTF
jgi:hypothetical protein